MHGEVGGLEQVEGRPLEGSFRKDQAKHRQPLGWISPAGLGRTRHRFAISIAVQAASNPLLPALVPARSTACSMVSVVSTPKTTGNAGVQLDPLDARRALPGHEVVVAGRPADRPPRG